MRAFFPRPWLPHASLCLCDGRVGIPHHGYPCSSQCMVRNRTACPVEEADMTDADPARSVSAECHLLFDSGGLVARKPKETAWLTPYPSP